MSSEFTPLQIRLSDISPALRFAQEHGGLRLRGYLSGENSPEREMDTDMDGGH